MQRLFSNLRKSTLKSPDTKSPDSHVVSSPPMEGYVKEKVDDYERLVQSQKYIDFNDMPPKDELDRMFEEFLADFLGDAPGNERNMREKMMRAQSDQSKWKIIKMNSTMKDKLTEDKPQPFVDKMKKSRSRAELLEYLKKLDVIMDSTNVNWIREFIRFKGVSVLFSGFEKYTSGVKKDEQESLQVVSLILKILERIMQHHQGVCEFLKIQYGIREITMSLASSDSNIRNSVISVLTTLVSLDDTFLKRANSTITPEGVYKLVVDGMDCLKTHKGEVRRFSPIVRLVQDTNGSDKSSSQSRLKLFQFISVMLALDERGDMRDDCEHLDFLKVIEDIEENIKGSEDSIDQQILQHIEVIQSVLSEDRTEVETDIEKLIDGASLDYELSSKVRNSLSLFFSVLRSGNIPRENLIDEINEILSGQVSLAMIRERIRAQSIELVSVQSESKEREEEKNKLIGQLHKMLEEAANQLKQQKEVNLKYLEEIEALKQKISSPKAELSDTVHTDSIEQLKKENELMRLRVSEMEIEVRKLQDQKLNVDRQGLPANAPLVTTTLNSTAPPPPPPMSGFLSQPQPPPVMSGIPPPPPPMGLNMSRGPPLINLSSPMITPPPKMNGIPPPPPFINGGSQMSAPPSVGGTPPPPMNIPPPPPLMGGGMSPPLPPMMGGLAPPPMMGGMPPPMMVPLAPVNLLPKLPTSTPKEKMKALNWVKLSESTVPKTIWMKSGIIADLGTVKLNEDMIEKLFSQKKVERIEVKEVRDSTPKKICLLDGKRQQQLSIFLGYLRRSNDVIKTAILQMDTTTLDPETIVKLINIAPTEEEIASNREYEGEEAMLSPPDKFVREMMSIPRLKFRLECWDFMQKFESSISSLQPNITTMKEACKELKNSPLWESVLTTILAIGNFINGQNSRIGNSYGFKIKSLNKIKDTRAQDNKSNLLHFIIGYLKENNPNSIEFLSELTNVELTSKVPFETIEVELGKLKKGCSLIEREYKLQKERDPSANDRFTSLLQQFIDEQLPQVSVVEQSYQQMQSELSNIAELYGEDVSKFPKKPEEFFQDLREFFADWRKTTLEVQKEEAKVVKTQDASTSSPPHSAQVQTATDDPAKNLARLLDPSEILKRREQMKHRRTGTILKSKIPAL